MLIIPHQKGSAYLFLEDSIICGIFYRNRTKNYTRYIYVFFDQSEILSLNFIFFYTYYSFLSSPLDSR